MILILLLMDVYYQMNVIMHNDIYHLFYYYNILYIHNVNIIHIINFNVVLLYILKCIFLRNLRFFRVLSFENDHIVVSLIIFSNF